jgi:predicted ATP-grasp superfamily ATP-dependent carboligase
MAKREPRYRIDPIEPGRIGPRFGALVTRLEPLLDAADVTALRSQIEHGDFEAAYVRLDALTDAATTEIETAALVELVLLGQAIRPT